MSVLWGHITVAVCWCGCNAGSCKERPQTLLLCHASASLAADDRGIRRLKEGAMAFNFLAGAHPATALQLLFICWPAIPPGTGTVSGDKLDFTCA